MNDASVGILAFTVIMWAVNCMVGYAIGKGKGRGRAGFWCGFWLGWIGWIVAACLRPSLEWESQRAAMVAKAVRGSGND